MADFVHSERVQQIQIESIGGEVMFPLGNHSSLDYFSESRGKS